MYVKSGPIKILTLHRLHPSALHIQMCLYSHLYHIYIIYADPGPKPSVQFYSSITSVHPRRASVRSSVLTIRFNTGKSFYAPTVLHVSSWLESRDWLHWRLEEKPSLGHFFLFGLLFWTFSVESIYGPAWECGGVWGKGISNYRQWACPCLDKNRNSLVFCVILKPTSEQ